MRKPIICLALLGALAAVEPPRTWNDHGEKLAPMVSPVLKAESVVIVGKMAPLLTGHEQSIRWTEKDDFVYRVEGGPGYTNHPRNKVQGFMSYDAIRDITEPVTNFALVFIVSSLSTNSEPLGTGTINGGPVTIYGLRRMTNRVVRRELGNNPPVLIEAWTNTYPGPLVATNIVPAPVVFRTNSSSMFIDAMPPTDWRGL
jgi:hypothetical protein